MQTQITVVFHSADLDGLFCQAIARHFLGQDGPAGSSMAITYIGWDYGDAKLDFPAEGQVYVMDVNPECFNEFPGIDEAKSRVVWIDHHRTSLEKWGTYLPGYRIDGVAACRLAWQWFGDEHIAGAVVAKPLPEKQDFIDRKVNEPLAVRLAGEYDVHDLRGDGQIEFQLGLKAQEEIPWELLLEDGDANKRLPAEGYVARLIQVGRMVQTYVKKQNALKMKGAFIHKWRGLTWLAYNGGKGNSQVFESVDTAANGHDALMIFGWNGKVWEFSLYGAKHRPDIDLSKIAAEYGGGGHRSAAGFQTNQIPFPLYPTP